MTNLKLDTLTLAERYEKISDNQFKNGQILIEKLGVKAGDNLLDIGCGTGRLGRFIADKIGPSGSLVGIDPLEERIKIARQQNRYPNIVFKTGTSDDLTFLEDNSTDIVYLSAVFHWIVNKEATLAEIQRVLKPEGKLGITTGAKELRSSSKLQAITESVLKREPYSKFVNLEESVHNKYGVTTTELIQLLVKSRFKVVDIQIKTTQRNYQKARQIIEFSEASSFGNYLSHVPESLREKAKTDIEAEFKKYQTEKGIDFEGYTIFAIAQKPKETS
jgi:ubiquinone/menaquinone biosynthesis C-methylase UbiE